MSKTTFIVSDAIVRLNLNDIQSVELVVNEVRGFVAIERHKGTSMVIDTKEASKLYSKIAATMEGR